MRYPFTVHKQKDTRGSIARNFTMIYLNIYICMLVCVVVYMCSYASIGSALIPKELNPIIWVSVQWNGRNMDDHLNHIGVQMKWTYKCWFFCLVFFVRNLWYKYMPFGVKINMYITVYDICLSCTKVNTSELHCRHRFTAPLVWICMYVVCRHHTWLNGRLGEWVNGWKDERMNGREWTYHVLYKCEGGCEWILWEYSHFWMIVQIWVGTFVLTQWEYLYPCGFLWHFVGISTLVWVDVLWVCVSVWICMCELWHLNSCSFVVLYHEKCVPLSLHYPWHDNRMFIHAVCPSVVGRLVGHTFKRDKNKTSLQIPIVSHLPVIFSDDN